MKKKIIEVLCKLTAFMECKYRKADILGEYLKLQREILELVFDREHILNARLTIWDAYNQLERENQEKGGIVTKELEEFKQGCRTLNNLIRAEISGNRGESLVINRLSALKGVNKFLQNVELTQGDAWTECDMIVFTEKAQFIIEVKNTKKNVFFDEEGGYYRNSEYKCYDSNLRHKMDFRAHLLEKLISGKLAEKGKSVNIVKLVVFTNRYIEIQNKCEELKTCFLGELPYLIDEYVGDNLYSEEDIEELAENIGNAVESHEIELEMDMQKFKADFAKVLVRLENCEEPMQEVVEQGQQVSQPVERILEIPEFLTRVEPGKEKDSYFGEWLLGAAGLLVAFGIGMLTGNKMLLHK